MKSIEKEESPWGRFFELNDKTIYNHHRIEVDQLGTLSYQHHYKRSEAWTIVEGVGTITLDGNFKDFFNAENIIIPQGLKHRIENKGVRKSSYY